MGVQDDPNLDKGKGGDGGGDQGGGQGESPFKALMAEKNFKTEEEAVKYVKELDEKVTKTAQERDTYQKYYPYSLAFSSYLKSNPKAMEDYKKWSAGGDEDAGDEAGDEGDDKGKDKGNHKLNPKDEAARKDISELMNIEKDRIVSNFDQKFGLSKLSDEDYNRVASSMGNTLRSWGIDLRNPSVEMIKRLDRALTDAYALTQISKAKETGKLEGLIEFQRNEAGRIPAIPSGGIEDTGDITEETLSDREKQVAAKMHLTPKEYADQKKKIIQDRKK